MTVVGVAGNVRHFGLDSAARREMFRPYSQAAWPVMTVVAKTAAEPPLFTAAVRGALQHIDSDLPVGRGTTMEAVVTNSTGPRRFPMLLLSAFGAVALVLSIVGVYGVVSYVVTPADAGDRYSPGARCAPGRGDPSDRCRCAETGDGRTGRGRRRRRIRLPSARGDALRREARTTRSSWPRSSRCWRWRRCWRYWCRGRARRA